MLNPEKSISRSKSIDLKEKITKNKKILEGITESKRIKIKQLINQQLAKIRTSIDRELENKLIQKTVQNLNLEERQKLESRIRNKISHAQKLRQSNFERIQKQEKKKISKVEEANQKFHQNEQQKLKSEQKLQQQLSKDLGNFFTMKYQHERDYHKSVQALKTEYMNGVTRKFKIYQSSTQFADKSKQQFVTRMIKGQRNLKSAIESRLKQFIPHKVQVEKTVEKAKIIENQRLQSYINKYVTQMRRSEVQVRRNQQAYRNQKKIKNQSLELKKSQLTSNIFSLKSTFRNKIQSCICLSRGKKDKSLDNMTESELYYAQSRDRVEDSPTKSLRISWTQTKSSNFLPNVIENKQKITSQQRQRQEKIVGKHNEMQKISDARKFVLRKTSSIQRSALFNKERENAIELAV